MSGMRGDPTGIENIQFEWMIEIQEDLKDDYGIDLSIQEISDFIEDLGIDFNVDSPADAIYDSIQEQS